MITTPMFTTRIDLLPRLKQTDECYFLDEEHERAKGIVAGRINWRGENLLVIEIDDEDNALVVRPEHLVSRCPDEAIGFARHDDDLMSTIADLVLTQRYA